MNTKIYIAAHKGFVSLVTGSIYCPLQVGAAINETFHNDWIRDDSGDNISEKNLSYNELTGLYWIWKNSEEDIVGLCHYRRYFVSRTGKISNFLFHTRSGFLPEKYIYDKAMRYDLLVHNKTFFLCGNGEQFRSTKYSDDMKVVREVLVSDFPQYVESFDRVMDGKVCHLLNMLIGKKAVVDRYCEWLFAVLFAVEEKMIRGGETSFDRRMGMIGERLLDVWLVANHIRIKELFTINTEVK